MISVSTICQLYHWCQFYLSSHKGVTGTPCQGWILNRSHLTRSRNWHQTSKITTMVVSRTCETFDVKQHHFYIKYRVCNLTDTIASLHITVYLLSVYVCTFDARQHVVFINKLFEIWNLKFKITPSNDITQILSDYYYIQYVEMSWCKRYKIACSAKLKVIMLS